MKAKNRFTSFITTLILTLAIFMPSTAYAAPINKEHGQRVLAGGSDSDHDGLTNAQERTCGTNPKVADSNGNGVLDGADDQDHDGLTNAAEFKNGTRCKSSDSDHDGVSDGQEVSRGSNPRKADSDGDGVKDGSDNSPNDSRHH